MMHRSANERSEKEKSKTPLNNHKQQSLDANDGEQKRKKLERKHLKKRHPEKKRKQRREHKLPLRSALQCVVFYSIDLFDY